MKTISRKALSLVIVFSLLCSLLPVSGLAAFAATDSGLQLSIVPNINTNLVGALNSDFAGGDGTPDNPYLISTADQMKNVNKYLDSCFKLTKDIMVNTIIGDNSYHFFNGTFDGGNNTISLNISTDVYSAGLFGGIQIHGKVKNLTVAGNVIASNIKIDNPEVGAITGVNYGTITNCHAFGSVECDLINEANSSAAVGGLVGYNNGLIQDCDAACSVKVSNPQNEAVIMVGGLAGQSSGQLGVSVNEACKVERCYATGKVEGTSTAGYVYAGGLVGYEGSKSETEDVINDCYATGNVTGNAGLGSFQGGLVGYIDKKSRITGSFAAGDIVGSSNAELQGGGLIGTINGSNITDSYATGKVTGNAPKILTGGFAGFSYGNAVLSNCHSTGSATAEAVSDARVGGFIAQDQGNSNIQNCYSTGGVTANKCARVRVGGFVGYHRIGTINSCYATGNVNGSVSDHLSAAAIGGFAGVNLSAIEGCYAVGSISGIKTDTKLSDLINLEDTSSIVMFEFKTGVTSGSAISVSGFVGLNTNTGTITDSLFDKQTTGQTTGEGENYNTNPGNVSVKALETPKITGTAAKNNITEFDFTATWRTTANTNQEWYYPQLISEISLDSVTLPITITGFSELSDSVKNQNLKLEEISSQLVLPDKINAMLNGIYPIEINIAKWNNNIPSNPASDTYTFEPDLAGYTLANNVAKPKIMVTVQGTSNNTSSSSNTSRPTPPAQSSNQTETKVDPLSNTATVTTKPETVTTSGNTASMEAVIPSVVLDNTQSPTAGSTVDTGKKAAVMIQLPSAEIKEQLAAKKDVELTVTVPSDVARDTNTNVALSINANKEILEAAKESLSDVTIKIKDAGTQQLAYSWTFKGEDLAKSKVPVTDVNIAMSVHLTTEVPKVNAITPDKTGMVLSFDHSGELPSVASVTISALEKGFKPGQTLYFYYYNPTTKQIESLGKDAYTVDSQGNVTVQINHCSDYVLLPNAARSLTLDTKTYQMPLGGSYEIGVKRTDAKDTTVKVYSSTKGVANVVKLKNGNYKVTAKKAGLTYIMFDVYDKKGKLIVKSHASVRLTVKKGTVPNGDSRRQTAIF